MFHNKSKDLNISVLFCENNADYWVKNNAIKETNALVHFPGYVLPILNYTHSRTVKQIIYF